MTLIRRYGLFWVPAALLLLAFSLSACGGSGGSAAGSAEDNAAADNPNAQVVDLHAQNYHYDKTEYHVKTGDVKFVLHEDQGIHGAQIAPLGVNLQRDGASKTVHIAKPGTYTIRCSVPCGSGHLNMQAKLIVE